MDEIQHRVCKINCVNHNDLKTMADVQSALKELLADTLQEMLEVLELLAPQLAFILGSAPAFPALRWNAHSLHTKPLNRVFILATSEPPS